MNYLSHVSTETNYTYIAPRSGDVILKFPAQETDNLYGIPSLCFVYSIITEPLHILTQQNAPASIYNTRMCPFFYFTGNFLRFFLVIVGNFKYNDEFVSFFDLCDVRGVSEVSEFTYKRIRPPVR